MTKLKERPTDSLERRRERLVIENKEHLSLGRWAQYSRNCVRIARITEELHRRECSRYGREWEAYLA